MTSRENDFDCNEAEIARSGRPWSRYVTPEMEELEGPYADFAAFEVWAAEMKEELTDSTLEMIWYYASWCNAMDTN